jgi:hypothetical protein
MWQILRALRLAASNRLPRKVPPARRPAFRRPLLEPLEDRTVLSQFMWAGGAANNMWSNPDNWFGHKAPTAGSDLLFPAGAQQTTTNDDLNLQLNSITVSDNYIITGNPLTLTQNLIVGSGSLLIDNSTTVDGGVVSAGDSLGVGGNLTAVSGLQVTAGNVSVAVGGTLDV